MSLLSPISRALSLPADVPLQPQMQMCVSGCRGCICAFISVNMHIVVWLSMCRHKEVWYSVHKWSEYVWICRFLHLTVFITQFYSQCDLVSSRLRVSCLCGLLPSVLQCYTPPKRTHTHTLYSSPDSQWQKAPFNPSVPVPQPCNPGPDSQQSGYSHTSSSQTLAGPPPWRGGHRD